MKRADLRGISFLCMVAVCLLSVEAWGQAPWLINRAVSQAVAEGGTAVLTMSVTGELPITYTWRRNFEFTPYYQETLYSTNCTVVLTNMRPQDACFFNINVQNAYGYGPGSQVMVGVIAAGMETNGFGLTLYGLTNSTWRVDCTTNITEPEWFNVTTLSIPMGVHPPSIKFVDLEATNLNRFYKVTAEVQ